MASSDERPRARLQTVGVVGLGLIGGSIGLALRDPSRELVGCDISPHAQELALKRFCVDRIAALDEVAKSEVVFVAVPPGSVIEVAEAIIERRGPETVLTDCASVKGEIACWASKRRLPHFVPGHPMAGHEKGGVEFASAWLFRHARWILTPGKQTTKSATSTVESLIRDMGARPVRLPPDRHDRLVALLSHLPHVVAAALVLMGGEVEHLDVAAGSWRDITRVGGVDPNLWTQILMGNRQELCQVLEEFEGSITSLRTALADSDSPSLRRTLERAQAAKSVQDAKLPKVSSAAAGSSRRRGKR